MKRRRVNHPTSNRQELHTDGLLEAAMRNANINIVEKTLRKGGKLTTKQWEIAENNPQVMTALVRKLHKDGKRLYKVNILQIAKEQLTL